MSALAAEAPEDEAEKDGAEEAIAPLTWDLGKSMLAGQWANARLYSMLNKHGSARCAATVEEHGLPSSNFPLSCSSRRSNYIQ